MDKNWLPVEIAEDVEDYFRNRKQWKGWSKFLGLPPSRNVERDFRTYEQTKAWAKRKKIKNYNEWINIKKPFNIPQNPYKCYKNNGWTSWNDFLGISYFNFDEAKEFCKKYAKNNNIKTWTEFHKLEGKIHKKLPGSIYGYYSKDPKWISISDFIGTKFSKHVNYLKFEEAKELTHKLKLRNQYEFYQARKEGLLPITVPSAPDRVYGIKKHR